MFKIAISILLSINFIFTSNVFAEKIVLTTVNWEPIYGENLPENGFFTALCKEAFKLAGYEMEVEFLPWKRALESARKGKYDGLLGAYISEDRLNTFYYTDPIYSNDEVFVQNEDRGITYTKVEELRRYIVGGRRGAAQMDELRAMGFSLQETTDYPQSLIKLNLDRIDLVLMGRSQLLYILEHEQKIKRLQGKFEIIEPPYKSFNLYSAINKKRPDGQQVVQRFNQALKDMKANGSYTDILKRFGQD